MKSMVEIAYSHSHQSTLVRHALEVKLNDALYYTYLSLSVILLLTPIIGSSSFWVASTHLGSTFVPIWRNVSSPKRIHKRNDRLRAFPILIPYVLDCLQNRQGELEL